MHSMLDKSGKNNRMDPLWWEISNTNYKKKYQTLFTKTKRQNIMRSKFRGYSRRNTPYVTLLIKLKQPLIALYKIQNNLSECLV